MVDISNGFWEYLQGCISKGGIHIDRPRGSRHWYYTDFVYPLDYGYIKNTHADDNEELDVWVGTAPGRGVVALLASLDTNRADAELKVVYDCTDAEIDQIANIYNSGGLLRIVIRRTDL